jgi:hypothetical protein
MERYEIEVEVGPNQWQVIRREDNTFEEAKASLAKLHEDDVARHEQDIKRHRLPEDHVHTPRNVRVIRYTREIVA